MKVVENIHKIHENKNVILLYAAWECNISGVYKPCIRFQTFPRANVQALFFYAPQISSLVCRVDHDDHILQILLCCIPRRPYVLKKFLCCFRSADLASSYVQLRNLAHWQHYSPLSLLISPTMRCLDCIVRVFIILCGPLPFCTAWNYCKKRYCQKESLSRWCAPSLVGEVCFLHRASSSCCYDTCSPRGTPAWLWAACWCISVMLRWRNRYSCNGGLCLPLSAGRKRVGRTSEKPKPANVGCSKLYNFLVTAIICKILAAARSRLEHEIIYRPFKDHCILDDINCVVQNYTHSI